MKVESSNVSVIHSKERQKLMDELVQLGKAAREAQRLYEEKVKEIHRWDKKHLPPNI